MSSIGDLPLFFGLLLYGLPEFLSMRTLSKGGKIESINTSFGNLVATMKSVVLPDERGTFQGVIVISLIGLNGAPG